PHLGSDARRITGRSDLEARGGGSTLEVKVWQVVSSRRRVAQVVVLDVADDTDDLHRRRIRLEPSSNRAPARKIESREALVHECDVSRLIVVARFEVAALKQPRADCRRVVRTHLIVFDRRVVRGMRGKTLGRYARLRLRAAENPVLRVSHAGNAGDR